MTFAEVAEGVRAALAAYTQALDDGRTDDVVATFCPDGAIEIPGLGTHRGHDALRQAYENGTPKRPQRHLVLNTLVTEWGETEATAISDVVFLLLGESGWAVQLVGRYHDVLHTTTAVAIPPARRHIRDGRSTTQGERMTDDQPRLRHHRLLPRQRAGRRPVPVLRLAAAQCPVRREPQQGVYMVTGYDEACAVYNDTDTFSSCNSVTGPFPGFPVPLAGERHERADRPAPRRAARSATSSPPWTRPSTATTGTWSCASSHRSA